MERRQYHVYPPSKQFEKFDFCPDCKVAMNIDVETSEFVCPQCARCELIEDIRLFRQNNHSSERKPMAGY